MTAPDATPPAADHVPCALQGHVAFPVYSVLESADGDAVADA